MVKTRKTKKSRIMIVLICVLFLVIIISAAALCAWVRLSNELLYYPEFDKPFLSYKHTSPSGNYTLLFTQDYAVGFASLRIYVEERSWQNPAYAMSSSTDWTPQNDDPLYNVEYLWNEEETSVKIVVFQKTTNAEKDLSDPVKPQTIVVDIPENEPKPEETKEALANQRMHLERRVKLFAVILTVGFLALTPLTVASIITVAIRGNRRRTKPPVGCESQETKEGKPVPTDHAF